MNETRGLRSGTWYARLRGFYLGGMLLACSVYSATTPRNPGTVIFPQPADAGSSRPADSSWSNTLLFAAVVFGLAAWLWIKFIRKGRKPMGKNTLIAVDETRQLGNRQYLVVASCRGRSFFLGVSQNRIDLIAEVPPPELKT